MRAPWLLWAWSVGAACEPVARFDPAQLQLPDDVRVAPPTALSAVDAFYSGHSLSDGVAEHVAAAAGALGMSFAFSVHSMPGSLLRQRLEDPAWHALTNRVSAADTIVVTERHDLPYALVHEGTLPALSKLVGSLSNGPRQLYLYHTWLDLDWTHPAGFVDYEEKALTLWECVASAFNRDQPVAEDSPRMKVLPGGAVLAELARRVLAGDQSLLPGSSPEESLRLLFRDSVHLSELGVTLMGWVHYAALFGRSPEGLSTPSEISSDQARKLQSMVWDRVSGYMSRAALAAQRPMSVCREYARLVLCPAFAAHGQGGEGPSWWRRWREERACGAALGASDDPASPFRD